MNRATLKRLERAAAHLTCLACQRSFAPVPNPRPRKYQFTPDAASSRAALLVPALVTCSGCNRVRFDIAKMPDEGKHRARPYSGPPDSFPSGLLRLTVGPQAIPNSIEQWLNRMVGLPIIPEVGGEKVDPKCKLTYRLVAAVASGSEPRVSSGITEPLVVMWVTDDLPPLSMCSS